MGEGWRYYASERGERRLREPAERLEATDNRNAGAPSLAVQRHSRETIRSLNLRSHRSTESWRTPAG